MPERFLTRNEDADVQRAPSEEDLPILLAPVADGAELSPPIPKTVTLTDPVPATFTLRRQLLVTASKVKDCEIELQNPSETTTPFTARAPPASFNRAELSLAHFTFSAAVFIELREQTEESLIANPLPPIVIDCPPVLAPFDLVTEQRVGRSVVRTSVKVNERDASTVNIRCILARLELALAFDVTALSADQVVTSFAEPLIRDRHDEPAL